MDEMKVSVADLQAAGDVVDWITEQTDSMDAPTAIAMMDALTVLAAKVAMAKSLCETQAKKLLDGQPIRVDDKIYVEKSTGKWRPNQEKIRSRVARIAVVDTDTGEIIGDADAAARKAVDLMYALFVSPSQMPKQGGMKQLGLDTKDVAEWEKTGTELKVVDV